jgi:caffeoyl-CoA O-methyltransferase
MFFGGAVIDPEMDNDWVQAIRDLNAKLRDDERVSLSLVPIGDGLSLCRRRG